MLLWILCTLSVRRFLPLRTPIPISGQWDALTIHADIVDVHVDRKELFKPFIAVHQCPLPTVSPSRSHVIFHLLPLSPPVPSAFENISLRSPALHAQTAPEHSLDRPKILRQSQIQQQIHWLLRYRPLSDLGHRIWTHRCCSHSPRESIITEPGDVAVIAGSVLVAVLRVAACFLGTVRASAWKFCKRQPGVAYNPTSLWLQSDRHVARVPDKRGRAECRRRQLLTSSLDRYTTKP